MRYLIDGYNVMHALGLMLPRFGPHGLRNARQKFLNQVASGFGPLEATGITVVFDAQAPPQDVPRETVHKGVRCVFASDASDADERIETILDRDTAPRSLTVVSSDIRLRRAAQRRGARSMVADDFCDLLKVRQRNRAQRREAGTGEPSNRPASPSPASPDRPLPRAADRREWLAIFGDLDAELNSPDAPGAPGRLGLTDAEIARIRREIEAEASEFD